MDDNLLEIVKKNNFFSELDQKTLETLINKISKVNLKEGQSLFTKGDPVKYVYILYNGRLSATLTNDRGQIKQISNIYVGDLIGEMSALAKTPHQYSVKALISSRLYKIPKDDFLEICYKNPNLTFDAISPIITRSINLNAIFPNSFHNDKIAIIPADTHIPIDAFANYLISISQKDPDIILISDYLPEFNGEIKPKKILDKIKQMENTKTAGQIIIYLFKNLELELTKNIIESCEKLYLIGTPLKKPKINDNTLKMIKNRNNNSDLITNLILTHPEYTKNPQRSATWLSICNFNMHHHVRLNDERHYKRLIRFFKNQAVGLVLGGGGTRGWGHVGALKALRKHNQTIDYIGGTSVGAIVGACYATNESYEDTLIKFTELYNASRKTVSWRSLTFPIISLYDAKQFTSKSQELFADMQIEDLWIPFYCISCNLSHYKEEIHQSGTIWKKIRASSSLPGIIPPMEINGELHFDGGLFNNLPVDTMRDILGEKSTIIAIELSASMHDEHNYKVPPIFTFKQALLYKLKSNKENYKFPRFMDTFLRGLLAGSNRKSKENCEKASLLICLSLQKYGLLNFNKKQAAKMLEIGVNETTTKINEYESEVFLEKA